MIQFRSRTLVAAAVAAVLAMGAVPDASAQFSKNRSARHQEEKKAEQAPRYPQATRAEPREEGSRRMRKQLNAMITAYNSDDFAKARSLSAEILAEADASNYDKALAHQIAGNAAYDMDDTAAAIASLEQVIALDALDNNAHYGAMVMLAQLQINEGQETAGLATLDRFLEETKSQDAQFLILKGNTLYNLERYPEAAAATKAAIAASTEPQPTWTQLLMGIYLEMDDPQEAMRVAEELAAASPADKRAQLNLASVYLQNDQKDKAAQVLEAVRASGQLTEADEYRQLYATYLNMDGHEADAIAVIEDGLAKGIIKPNHEAYVALAQSYYFSEQDEPAIEAYRKAAPLADDGETYLNLARVLWQNDRIAEAKEAAQQALDKGLDKPEDARKILALP